VTTTFLLPILVCGFTTFLLSTLLPILVCEAA
jgi:hypothetical protein